MMSSVWQNVIQQLPVSLQIPIEKMLKTGEFTGWLTSAEVQHLQFLSELDEQALIFALLPLAATYAQVPLSQFQVGAIAKGESGALYFGANMEFEGVDIQQTIHAEQCAIAHAWMQQESSLLSVSVNYSPCGHCRQFMNELNSRADLLICLPKHHSKSLQDYLPNSFGPDDLGVSVKLFDPQQHQLNMDSDDPLIKAALMAANRSHAPYTQSYSGVAIQSASGAIFSGSYAENAAFNPSLPPLQVALIMLNMTERGVNQPVRAVLLESSSVRVKQHANTFATLNSLGCSKIQHIVL